jgi:hypothetical protein
MNLKPFASLSSEWRDKAKDREEYSEFESAGWFRRVADELEERIRECELEELTLQEAVWESGYSYSKLEKDVRSGVIPNAGEPGAPRIRRCDLPYKAGGSRGNTRSGAPDLAEELLQDRWAC